MECGLTAGERKIGNLVIGSLPQEFEYLGLAELVAKGLAGTALFDAMQASKVALVGDLPGNVERSTQLAGSGGRWRGFGHLGSSGLIRP
jgi:hypothetical protein